MNQALLEQYGRHILLPQIGVDGQKSIASSTVMVVGCGGLGNAAIAYLAASGVHNLVVADYDVIDQGHIQRQILFGRNDVRKAKADVIEAHLMDSYPGIVVTPIRQKLNLATLLQCLKSCDVLLDCSDSEQTRMLLNEAAKLSGTPFVTAAVSGFEAKLAVFDFMRPESPCYQSLPDALHFTQMDAQDYTVLSPIVGVAGCMQAQEALRLLAGFGESQACTLVEYNALTWSMNKQVLGLQDAKAQEQRPVEDLLTTPEHADSQSASKP